MSMVRIVVCGARSWENHAIIEQAMVKLAGRYGRNRLLVIEGGMPGVDLITAEVCRHLGIHVAQINALWEHYNHGAGSIRNEVMMGLDPHLCVAFHWSLKAEHSKGTRSAVQIARRYGVPVRFVRVPQEKACKSVAGWRELQAGRRAAREKRGPRKPKPGSAKS